MAVCRMDWRSPMNGQIFSTQKVMFQIALIIFKSRLKCFLKMVGKCLKRPQKERPCPLQGVRLVLAAVWPTLHRSWRKGARVNRSVIFALVAQLRFRRGSRRLPNHPLATAYVLKKTDQILAVHNFSSDVQLARSLH